jgi:hypothetical protein
MGGDHTDRIRPLQRGIARPCLEPRQCRRRFFGIFPSWSRRDLISGFRRQRLDVLEARKFFPRGERGLTSVSSLGTEEAPNKGVRWQKLDAKESAPMVRSDEVIE